MTFGLSCSGVSRAICCQFFRSQEVPRTTETEIVLARLDRVTAAFVEQEQIDGLGLDLRMVGLLQFRALADDDL